MPDANHWSEQNDSPLITVGQALQVARDNKGLTPEQLADQLHIGVEQLLALETGQSEDLPEPVFIKAMVRRIASYLQINPDPLVDQLKKSTPVKPRPIVAALTSPPATQHNQAKTAKQRRPVIWLLPLIMVVGGGALAFSRIQRAPSPTISMAPLLSEPVESTPTDTPIGAPLVISSTQPSWITLRRNGTIEFEGVLDGSRQINNAEGVEIYAGRPDLVLVTSGKKNEEPLGPITPLRWYSLSPEL